MTERNHQEYYIGRATSCRQSASRAIDPAIAAIHTDLAARYERLAAEPRSNDGDPLAVL